MQMTNTIIKAQKILVIHSGGQGGIGDTILGQPALRALRHSFPDSEIHFLGGPRQIEMLHSIFTVDKEIVFDSTVLRHSCFKGICSTLKIIQSLRQQKYDVLFVLQPQLSSGAALRMGIFVRMLGVRYRYGRTLCRSKLFFTHAIQEKQFGTQHEVERMKAVVGLFGAVCKNSEINIPLPAQARDNAAYFVRTQGIDSAKPCFALAPGFGKRTRSWFPERWAHVGDRLVERYDAHILIVGGQKEIELAQNIAQIMRKKPIIAAGRTSLIETATLLKQCNLVVSNDSGAMHIAAAVQTPVVALFGPGDYHRIRPYINPEKYAIVSKNVPCAPCYKETCAMHACMRSITVDDVFRAVMELLGSKKGVFFTDIESEHHNRAHRLVPSQ
ncbi:MAG: hypothetical protein GF384_06975 [Elusimicrobia bacterium]|nr:hypothetical protein [Elusimicrobiota bacterium]